MTKPTEKPRGRPPKIATSATLTLGSVSVTVDQLAQYDKAAKLEGVTRTEWLTTLTDKAAARIIKKHCEQ